MEKLISFTKILYINIFTISEYDSLESQESTNKFKSDLWKQKCLYLKNYLSEKDFLDQEYTLYTKKANIYPEFGKIACISFGLLGHNEIGETSIQLRSYFGDNELNILNESVNLINFYHNNILNSNNIPKLSGFNIKNVIYPYITKRLLINNIQIPNLLLNIQELKPWELPFIDISDVWNCTVYNQNSTLEQISECINIPVPNNIIKYPLESLNSMFYKNKIDYEYVKMYCENDLIKSINLLLKSNNYEVVNNFKFI